MGMSWKEIQAVINEWRQEQEIKKYEKILQTSEDDKEFKNEYEKILER